MIQEEKVEKGRRKQGCHRVEKAGQVLGSGHCLLPYEGDLDRDQHEGLGIQVSGEREVQAKQSVSAKVLRQESASMEKRLRQTMTCITKKTARKMQKLSFTCENTGTRFKITEKKINVTH